MDEGRRGLHSSLVVRRRIPAAEQRELRAAQRSPGQVSGDVPVLRLQQAGNRHHRPDPADRSQ